MRKHGITRNGAVASTMCCGQDARLLGSGEFGHILVNDSRQSQRVYSDQYIGSWFPACSGPHSFGSLEISEPLTFGNNVYLDNNVILLPRVTIGDNVVIAAYSVVSRDVPSNSVVMGVPARVMKTSSRIHRLSLLADFMPSAFIMKR